MFPFWFRCVRLMMLDNPHPRVFLFFSGFVVFVTCSLRYSAVLMHSVLDCDVSILWWWLCPRRLEGRPTSISFFSLLKSKTKVRVSYLESCLCDDFPVVENWDTRVWASLCTAFFFLFPFRLFFFLYLVLVLLLSEWPCIMLADMYQWCWQCRMCGGDDARSVCLYSFSFCWRSNPCIFFVRLAAVRHHMQRVKMQNGDFLFLEEEGGNLSVFLILRKWGMNLNFFRPHFGSLEEN